MIIKLSDGDVTVAQDSIDDQGIIHIPENVWDHIVQEVQHPDQSFVNELYINVQDLNIQQPYEISKIKLRNVSSNPSTLITDSQTNWTFWSITSTFTPSQGSEVLIIRKGSYDWYIRYGYNWPSNTSIHVDKNSWVYSNNLGTDMDYACLFYTKNGNDESFCILHDDQTLNTSSNVNMAEVLFPLSMMSFNIPWMTFT